MSDPRVINLAKILVHYSTEVQPGDKVLIFGVPTMSTSMPLVEQVFREVLRAGGHPIVYPKFQNLEFTFFMEANEQQLTYVDPFYSLAINEFDCLITILGAINTKNLNTIDPGRQSIWAKANNEVWQVKFRRESTRDL